MRAQYVALLLLVVAQQHVCHARQLRQLTVQCPDQLSKPVLMYMQSAKYKDAVAKACVKRAKPDCYMDCTCAAYSTVGAVLTFEGLQNYPALYKKYGAACLFVFINQVLETVLPEHVKQDIGRKVCLDKTMDWAKDEQAVSKCPALADYVKEKRAERTKPEPSRLIG